MISLEQAKQLVELLESGQQQDADILVKDIYENASNPMLQEIGALTRDLHESIKHFSVDERISEIAKDEIPDARDRLQYVIDKTEVAANKTMDSVDRCMPIAKPTGPNLICECSRTHLRDVRAISRRDAALRQGVFRRPGF